MSIGVKAASALGLAALLSVAGAAVGGGLPLPHAPRPGSGRERAMCRSLARAIAADTGLDIEAVYQALGRGETETEIRSGGRR